MHLIINHIYITLYDPEFSLLSLFLPLRFWLGLSQPQRRTPNHRWISQSNCRWYFEGMYGDMIYYSILYLYYHCFNKSTISSIWDCLKMGGTSTPNSWQFGPVGVGFFWGISQDRDDPTGESSGKFQTAHWAPKHGLIILVTWWAG